MALKLRAVDGSLAAWAPPDPRRVLLRVEAADRGPASEARARAVAAAARGALAFLGFEAADAAPGGAADMSLPAAAAPVEAADFEARGFSRQDFHYFCLKTHFRKPLPFTWDGLAQARRELADLKASAAALAGVTLEPSSRGVTGYQHRFREVLSRDFDFPEALACVWDGLRPGALSPGSKAALVRAALPALGLQ